MQLFARLSGSFVIVTAVGIAPAWTAELGRTAADLRTEDTTIGFAVIGNVPQITNLNGNGLHNWLSGTPEATLPTDVKIGVEKRVIRWKFSKMSAQGNAIRFFYECDEPKLEAVSTWSAVSGPGPVEHDLALSNKSGASLTFRFTPTVALALQPQANHRIEHWWVHKGAGYVLEDGGTFTEAMQPGYAKVQHSGPYSDDSEHRDAVPWFAIHDANGMHGIYGGIEFSGWTDISVKRADDGAIALTLGMQLRDNAGSTNLQPGNTYHFPTCFVGTYRGEVDDGCNRLHRWVEGHLRPKMPWGVTPVLVNNSWGCGMAIDESRAKRMIDDCAALGMELYHIDAGWFQDVGNWHTNAAKFPSGLEKLADYAHSKGIKFGAWVGWTQGGGSKTNQPVLLSVFNPDQKNWFGRDMPADWKNQDYTGEPVCLGAAGARAWCLADLQRMVKEYRLDLLEHDQSMIVDRCDREGHEHIPSDPVDVSRAAADGYYDVYDRLRQDNPHLLFEDCVNGGRLVDFGVAKRVHYFSATDTYDPLTCRRAFYDSSYPFPPSMIELYLANVPGKTLTSFTSMLRSAMLGWATIMIDTTQWTPAQREIAKREFALYKDRLRPLISAANLYHILPRPSGNRWDGVQYHDPRTGAGAVFVFRGNAKESTRMVKLRGLRPTTSYAIECIDGSTATKIQTGKQLMEDGLGLSISDESGSDLIFLSATR